MPKEASAEDCMDHYQRERDYRATTSWPMPESYATTKDYVDYRDLLLRVQPREDGSLTFGPGHPVQVVISGATKIIPSNMQEILSDYADDEDLPAILEDTVFVGVKGSVYPTVEGYTPSSYAAE